MTSPAGSLASSVEFSPVTDALFSRLRAADVAAVLASLTPEEKAVVGGVEPESPAYKRMIIHIGVHHEIPGVLAKTGLTAADPPQTIHSMGRGSLAAGGSAYYADLVSGAMQQAGADLPPGASILDFGCSSGRVIRVLKAFDATCECSGCDPNRQAIEWAQQNLAPIDFAVSPLRPPLGYPAGGFDLVFAISIWSHMNQRSSRAWLAEMRRIIRPGGFLLLTFHGMHSVNYYASHGLHEPRRIEKIRADLERKGFAFFNRFGPEGDWGVKDREWGEAYLSLRWLDASTKDAWDVLYFQAGIVEGNQDLAVLRARSA